MRFTKFSGIKANQPLLQELPLDNFLSQFERHVVVADKSHAATWSPAIYKSGATRGNTGVEAVTALVFDVDDGTPVGAFEEKLDPFAYVIHSSFSHTNEHPKYRVILPLKHDVSVRDWPHVWLRANLLVDGHADQATKDPARVYFMPSKRAEGGEHFSVRHEGRLIDVDDLPQLPVQSSERPRARGHTAIQPAEGARDLTVFESDASGLGEMLNHCRFMRDVSLPEHQASVPEPLWMAMLSNACRFSGGRTFAHKASCEDDRYNPEETDSRLARHRVESAPITCQHIRTLGYDGCPSGGCALPHGGITRAPAGLGVWSDVKVVTEKAPHPVITKAYLENQFPEGLLYANSEFFRYRAGAFDQLHEGAEVERPLASFLSNAADSGFVRKLSKLIAMQLAETDTGFQPNLDRLCLLNGTLNLETLELEPHSPENRLRTRLDVSWDPTAGCPKFMAYLDGVFQDDPDRQQKISFVQEWMGYLLVADTSMQKMLWLVGAGANGKSVLLAIIEALVGRKNISNAMLDSFHLPHVRAELEGKLVNVAGEMAADSMINDGYIKAIVAGDVIEASKKYKPSISFKPFVRLMAATNNLPRTNDLSHGFFRRTIILTFTHVFAAHEQNPNLVHELKAELSGILPWALQGLKRLREQGRFTIPVSSEAALNQYRVEADPVRLFSEECLVSSTQHRVESKQLYEVYSEWCKAYGFSPRNSSTLGVSLRNLGFEKLRSGGKNYWRIAYVPAAAEYANVWLNGSPVQTDISYVDEGKVAAANECEVKSA